MDDLIAFPSTYEFPVRRRLSDQELLGPVPDAPVFPEALDDIRARYSRIVGTPKISRDLHGAHHRIRRLLREDDDRREAQRLRGYFSSYDGPKFDTPFEQRRLRVLNSLMLETSRAGAQIKADDQSARSIKIRVNDATLFLKLDHKKRLEHQYGYYSETDRPAPGTPLHLVLSTSWSGSSDDLRWPRTRRSSLSLGRS